MTILLVSEDSNQNVSDESALTASSQADLSPVEKFDLRAATDSRDVNFPQFRFRNFRRDT